MSQDARRDEEVATQRRARILGLDYIDTSRMADKPLFKELLSPQELYQMRVIPISIATGTAMFRITNTTSQHVIRELERRFNEMRIGIALISDAAFRDY